MRIRNTVRRSAGAVVALGVAMVAILAFAQTSVFAVGGEACASATVIGSLPYSDTGSTVGANDDYDEGSPGTGCPTASASGDVVYSYTPAGDECVDLTLCDSSYDTKLIVFAGACTGPVYDCDDDGCGGPGDYESTIPNLDLTGGTTYFLVVDGWDGDEGDYVLDIATCAAPIVNETCASATVISSLPFTTTGTTSGADDDYDEGALPPGCPWESSSGDVVFSYTPTSNECVDVSLCDSGYDTKLIAYENDCTGTAYSCDDDSCASYPWQSALFGLALTGSNTYFFVVDGYNGNEGAFELVVDACATPPTNDTCATATVVGAGTHSETVVYRLATDDIDVACNEYNCTESNNGVWWHYVPPEYCVGIIDVGGDDTVVTIFTGADCDGAVEVACSDEYGPTEHVEYEMTDGLDYWIMVSAHACFLEPGRLIDFTFSRVVPDCGNGTVEPGEDCDDGNTVDHDGCSSACRDEGACCDGTTCVLREETACGAISGATFLGGDRDCAGDPCATGACCAGDGMCADTDQVGCTDRWLPGLPCSGIACNDDCENAVALTMPTSFSVDITGATDDPVEYDGECPGDFPGDQLVNQGVWYLVTGTGTTITATTCNYGGDFDDTRLKVWCESCEEKACIDGSDDDCSTASNLRSTVTWCSELGAEYLVSVGGYGDEAGLIQLDVSEDGVPCDTAPSCTCGNGALDPGEQCDDGNRTDGDGCDSNCTDTGCGNGIVTDGEECDDGNTTDGDGCSSTCVVEPPSNDECPNATAITSVPFDDLDVGFPLATDDTNVDPSCDYCVLSSADNGVWYKYTPPEDQVGRIESAPPTGYQYATKSVYTGEACESLSEVACRPNEWLTFPMAASTTYWILVSNESCDHPPDDPLNISFDAQALANDDCEGAIAVGALPTSLSVDVSFAMEEDPSHDELCGADAGRMGKGVWYAVEGSGAIITAATCNEVTELTTVLKVWSGDCSDLVCVGGSFDQPCGGWENRSIVSWASVPGQTYLISVGTFNFWWEGDIQLDIWACGDGTVNATHGEECDDGNTIEGDGCDAYCREEVCGNGFLQFGEDCDDGNTIDGDCCEHDCTAPDICGDDCLVPGEQCDDGNTEDGDGCRSDCTEEVCGDSIQDPGETCDEGEETVDCDADCTAVECGDGMHNATAGEECDDGGGNSDTTPDACRTDCTAATCGDGVIDSGEECDEGPDNSDEFPAPCLTDCTRRPINPADLDQDGDVGASDLARFMACLTEPGGSMPPACLPEDWALADSDGDGDVDMDDARRFQLLYSDEIGPWPDSGCQRPIPCDPDPAELTVCFDSPGVSVPLYSGFYMISANVGGGNPPYVYEWSPTCCLDGPLNSDTVDMYLEGGGACCRSGDQCEWADSGVACSMSGGTWQGADTCCDTATCSGGVSTVVCDAVGDHTYTLTVTDAAMNVASDSITVHVNNFGPLVINMDDTVVGYEGDSMVLAPTSVTGGDGNYFYEWSPVGIRTETPGTMRVPTVVPGAVDFTLAVTDGVCGSASSEVTALVLPVGDDACADADHPTGETSMIYVAYDPGYGYGGQAMTARGKFVYLWDLASGTLRGSVELPSDIMALLVDSARRRGFASTRLEGQFTRAVTILDLDTMEVLGNVPLTDNVAAARGMDVIPSSGKVLIAASGARNGLFLIDPDTQSVEGAIQNVHHTGSFAQPLDVAVLEENGLSVAVVSNASSNYVTLVPLADITFTPD